MSSSTPTMTVPSTSTPIPSASTPNLTQPSTATPTLTLPSTTPTMSQLDTSIIASPGGGTPAQKRSMAKRARDTQSPELPARKKAKMESTCTPTTQPRAQNKPKRPHKACGNTSFDASFHASLLDFSSQNADDLANSEEKVDVAASQASQASGTTATMLGDLDVEMTPSSQEANTPPRACDDDDVVMSQPPSNVIIDERSKDSVLETPAQASLDTTQDYKKNGPCIAVKRVNFAPDEVVTAAASAAEIASVSDKVPAPAAAPEEKKQSSYCIVM